MKSVHVDIVQWFIARLWTFIYVTRDVLCVLKTSVPFQVPSELLGPNAKTFGI